MVQLLAEDNVLSICISEHIFYKHFEPSHHSFLGSVVSLLTINWISLQFSFIIYQKASAVCQIPFCCSKEFFINAKQKVPWNQFKNKQIPKQNKTPSPNLPYQITWQAPENRISLKLQEEFVPISLTRLQISCTEFCDEDASPLETWQRLLNTNRRTISLVSVEQLWIYIYKSKKKKCSFMKFFSHLSSSQQWTWNM